MHSIRGMCVCVVLGGVCTDNVGGMCICTHSVWGMCMQNVGGINVFAQC